MGGKVFLRKLKSRMYYLKFFIKIFQLETFMVCKVLTFHTKVYRKIGLFINDFFLHTVRKPKHQTKCVTKLSESYSGFDDLKLFLYQQNFLTAVQ